MAPVQQVHQSIHSSDSNSTIELLVRIGCYMTNIKIEKGTYNIELFFASLPPEKKLAILYELRQTFIAADGRFQDKQLKDLLIDNPLYAKCLLSCIEEV